MENSKRKEKFNRKRIEKALSGNINDIPIGLTREEKRELILKRAEELKNELHMAFQ